MYLIIDDERTLGCELIARKVEVGKKVLRQLFPEIECLCIDHDLGDAETGLDVIRWAIKFGYLPDKVQIVTMNPPARKAMEEELKAAGYEEDGSVFYSPDFLNNEERKPCCDSPGKDKCDQCQEINLADPKNQW